MVRPKLPRLRLRRRGPKIRLRRVRGRLRLRLRRPRLPRIRFRESLTKIPNILTYLRIVFIPFVVWFVAESAAASPADEPRWCLLAFGAFFLASVTDFVDGYLARRLNLSTLVGRFLDPIADKLIVMAALVQLAGIGRVPTWLAIVLIAREMFVNGLRSLAAREGFEVPVIRLGKIKTTFQMLGLGGIILLYPIPIPGTGWAIPSAQWGMICLYAALFFSLLSALLYVQNFVREILRREGHDNPPPPPGVE